MNRMMRRIFTATLLLSLLVVSSCSGDAEAPGGGSGSRGIVFVTLGAVGADVDLPSFKRLEENGAVRFADAVTTVPMSRPAMATLLTGVSPDRSGVHGDVLDVLPPASTTLASALYGAGWTTVGVTGTSFAAPNSGLSQGFEIFESPPWIGVGPSRYFPPNKTADEAVAERFGNWLETADDKPFFAWVHLSSAHGTANVSRERDDYENPYAEATVAVDAALTQVLDLIAAHPDADRIGIAVTGTHGAYRQEVRRGSSYWLTDQTLQVPLLMKLPGLPSAVGSAPVWAPDVPATLAGVAGVELDAQSEGVDLTRSIPGNERPRRAWTWATYDELGWSPLNAVQGSDGWEVFSTADLQAGRGEGAAFETAAERPAIPREFVIDEDLRTELIKRNLIGSGEETPSPPIADEEERDFFLAELERVRHAGARGRWVVLARVSRKMLESQPDNLAAIESRMYKLMTESAGPPLAIELAERGLKKFPLRPDLLHWAGYARLASRQDMENAELLLRASYQSAHNPNLQYDLACLRLLLDRPDEALEALDAAFAGGWSNWDHLEIDPDMEKLRTDPKFHQLLAKYNR